ncbi:MAG: hypothetical protein AAF483_08555 [Planctomycetota bacterium]
MPLARDPRNNRRRRVLRDQAEEESAEAKNRSKRRKREGDQDSDAAQSPGGAGYSQDVRRACGARLVQLIPVRRRSFSALVTASLLIPVVLLLAHYMIYVSGSLQWYGHPLAISLDASHPNSIAAWFSSHLWLLCLGTTILTFQLRRHKLDDYNGEYRLWFWLVFTCLLASMDSTTHLTGSLGIALDHWSQQTLSWSGPAVVKATLAVLIGMLGIRMCSELKTVPLSISFWLVGMVAWAGSAALAQEELRLEMSLQLRIWLKVTLWLGGLTAIWLASITYLRSVYMEAQRRFLARGRTAQRNAVPISQRIREAMPSFRREDGDESGETESRRGWRLPSFRRNQEDEEGAEAATQRERRQRKTRKAKQVEEPTAQKPTPEKQTAPHPAAPATRRNARPDTNTDEVDFQETEDTQPPRKRGLAGFFGLGRRSEADDDAPEAVSPEPNAKSQSDGDEASTKKRSWTNWIRAPKDSEDAQEYQKVPRGQKSSDSRRKAEPPPTEDEADSENKPRKGWFPFGRGKSTEEESVETAADKDTAETPKKKRGFFSRFTLQPPDENSVDEPDFQPVDEDRELPSTTAQHSAEVESNKRPARQLTKAERKRMRKAKQNRAA